MKDPVLICTAKVDYLILVNVIMEGEDNKSLAFWQQGHRAFFSREGSFAPDMWLVFEEFELVETL